MAVFGVKYPNRKSPKPFTAEHRKKLSDNMKGKRYQLGKKQSLETIAIRVASRKGYKHSEETKAKIGRANAKAPHPKGDKHPNWQGGKSFETYSVDWTNTLKISIRERDKYTCKICGEKQGDRAFCVHHIDYDKHNCNPDNLITLCIKCHIRTNYNKKHWINYFKLNI